MINERVFSANVGEPSTGNSGPDAIETDLDNLLANDQELSEKVVWKALDYKAEADKPSAYLDEQTTIFVATQIWQGVGNVIIKTEKYNNNVAIQYLQPNGSLSIPVMYRLAIPDMDTWSEWTKFVTSNPTDWIDAVLQNGWTGTLQYRKNQLGQLEIKSNMVSGTVALGTPIATLPATYSPTNNSPISAYDTVGKSMLGLVLLATGDLKLYNPTTDWTTGKTIMINAVIAL